ncbi:MAG: hypothetical protein ACYDFU_05840, partial [Nitrospirota bacterium]
MAVILALSPVSAFGLMLPGGSGQNVTNSKIYYIGVHRPDGSCETVSVLADNEAQAEETAKNGCDICTTEDLTSLFQDMTPARKLEVARTCPRY